MRESQLLFVSCGEATYKYMSRGKASPLHNCPGGAKGAVTGYSLKWKGVTNPRFTFLDAERSAYDHVYTTDSDRRKQLNIIFVMALLIIDASFTACIIRCLICMVKAAFLEELKVQIATKPARPGGAWLALNSRGKVDSHSTLK